MSDELYPKLSELGKLEALALVEHFKSKMRIVASAAIDDIYTDIPDYIESDSWTNYRNTLLAGLCDYRNSQKYRYDFQKIRQAIYQQFKEEITKDLNQDLLEEIESLKKSLEYEREMRRSYP